MDKFSMDDAQRMWKMVRASSTPNRRARIAARQQGERDARPPGLPTASAAHGRGGD
jgi:hypothetical protein